MKVTAVVVAAMFVLTGCGGASEPTATASPCEEQFALAADEQIANAEADTIDDAELAKTLDECADRDAWLAGFAAYPDAAPHRLPYTVDEAENLLFFLCIDYPDTAACAGDEERGAREVAALEPATPTPTPATESRVPPGSGKIVDGPGYALRVPDDWETTDLGGTLGKITMSPVDPATGGASSVMVVQQPSPSLTLDGLESAAEAELAATGATHISRQTNVQIDGREAMFYRSMLDDGGEWAIPMRHYLVLVDGTLFIVTMVVADVHDGVDQQILDSLILG